MAKVPGILREDGSDEPSEHMCFASGNIRARWHGMQQAPDVVSRLNWNKNVCTLHVIVDYRIDQVTVAMCKQPPLRASTPTCSSLDSSSLP